MSRRLLALALGVAIASPTVCASDLAREERLMNQSIDAIFDGDPVMLESEGHEFFSVWTESQAEVTRGSVLILHGRGLHPDWENVIRPLRVGLTEDGWNTLAIQMPVLESGAKYYDYEPVFSEAHPRIEAALGFIREQAEGPIVLVAHSCGAHMAMDWVRSGGSGGSGEFDAYVGIGMGATDYRQSMRQPFPLDRLSVPVLDVYGSADYPAVLRMAPERLELIRAAGHPRSAQQVIEGANHYMHERNDRLVDVVAGWLGGLELTSAP